MSRTLLPYRSCIPVIRSNLSLLRLLYAILTSSVLFLSGCEKKETSVIDSAGFPPTLESALITPDSVNLTSIPPGVSTALFAVTARVTHPDGPSHIAQVVCTLTPEGGGESISAGALLDDGVSPDLTKGDGVFSGQISLAVQSLLVGKYFCEVSAQDPHGYMSNVKVLPVVVSQINYPPVVSNLQAPDRIVIGGQTQQFRLMVRATDPNGQSDISKVFFNSFKPNGDASSGNPFLMYDDGSADVIIPPNFTSGDVVKGDSIYTLTVIITPTDSQGNPTAPGSYRFEFQATDRSNASSQKIIHTIQVVQ